MGCCCSRDPQRLIIIGPWNSGKTKILYKLGTAIGGPPEPEGTTFGFNMLQVEFNDQRYDVFDCSGTLEKHYYDGADGIILVLDSTDRPRLHAVTKEERQQLIGEHGEEAQFGTVSEQLEVIKGIPELSKLPLLIYANKQDLPEAMKIDEIHKTLNGLNLFSDGTFWTVQACEALTGGGVSDGMEWLSREIKIAKGQMKRTKARLSIAAEQNKK